MAANTKKSRKRKWTEVAIDNPAFFSGDMEGFVQLEELEDYTLESVVGEALDSRVGNSTGSTAGQEESKEKKIPKIEKETKKKKRKRKKKRDPTKADKPQSGDSKPEMTEAKHEDKSQNEPQGKNKNKKGIIHLYFTFL